MIVNRVARRFAVALASGFLVASHVAGQDALQPREGSLCLGRLRRCAGGARSAEARFVVARRRGGQPMRAFCLLALGRSDEGRKAIAGIVEADPLFQPAETQMSPRLVTVFRDVRKQLLPRIVQQSCAEAKARFRSEGAGSGHHRPRPRAPAAQRPGPPAVIGHDRSPDARDRLQGSQQGGSPTTASQGGGAAAEHSSSAKPANAAGPPRTHAGRTTPT